MIGAVTPYSSMLCTELYFVAPDILLYQSMAGVFNLQGKSRHYFCLPRYAECGLFHQGGFARAIGGTISWIRTTPTYLHRNLQLKIENFRYNNSKRQKATAFSVAF